MPPAFSKGYQMTSHWLWIYTGKWEDLQGKYSVKSWITACITCTMRTSLPVRTRRSAPLLCSLQDCLCRTLHTLGPAKDQVLFPRTETCHPLLDWPSGTIQGSGTFGLQLPSVGVFFKLFIAKAFDWTQSLKYRWILTDLNPNILYKAMHSGTRTCKVNSKGTADTTSNRIGSGWI